MLATQVEKTVTKTYAQTPSEPAKESPASTEASQEQAERAAFEAVRKAPDASMQEHRAAIEKAAPAPKRDDSGKFTKPTAGSGDEPTEPAAAAAAADDADASPSTKGKKAKDADDKPKSHPKLAGLKPKDRAEYAMAEVALRKDRYDDDDINALLDSKGPEHVIKLGLKRKLAQDEQAKGLAKLLQKKAATQTEQRSPEPEGDITDPDSDEGGIDPDPAQAEGLDEGLEDLTPAQRKKMQAKIDEAQAQANQARTQLRNSYIVGAIQRLSGDFPGLGDQDSLRSVVKQMQELDPTSASIDDPAAVEELMRKACWVEFGESIRQTARKNEQKQIDDTLDGQPSVPSTRGKDTRTMSDEDFEKAAYTAAKKSGGDLRESRRALAGV